MNITQFFEHWSIVENPYRGEEARTDRVFARVGLGMADAPPAPETPDDEPDRPEPVERLESTHADFEKILGDLEHPATAIVFGEKGSGKTAIRLQIARRIAAHNASHPDRKVFLIPYDDLNGHLDSLHRRLGGSAGKDPGESFRKIRLVDHIDALVSLGTGRIVNALIGGADDPPPADLGAEPVRHARKLPASVLRDLVMLQAVYDVGDRTGGRTQRLRRALRLPQARRSTLLGAAVWLGWVPALLLFAWAQFGAGVEGTLQSVLQFLGVAFALSWLAIVARRFFWERYALARVASRLARQLRTIGRPTEAWVASLARVDRELIAADVLPTTGSDEQRYAMLARLRRVVEHFGFVGIVVVIDRVDEPTLVHGDADKMRSIIWPMLNNKFLQHEGLGLKMLLPIELRHALFKESNAFFQEARLDKQNLIERLRWSGATLYDLCSDRLNACRSPDAEPIALLDMFAEDVSRRDLVDALDHMQQPRDAFKFLYRCITEHCSNVTSDEDQWQIPRLVLDTVRKSEADRVQALHRGIRPA